MPKTTQPQSSNLERLRRIALQFPETQVGISCGKQAFKARNKAFLFLGHDIAHYNVMLKLRVALPEAARLAAREPAHYAVGGHQWVKLTFPHDQSPPTALLERWIQESYRLLAPKTLVALLPTSGLPDKPAPAPTKKKSTKRA
jgi:hypothetical protein